MSCLHAAGSADELQGRELKVWWHDDATSYRGRVTSFDRASMCPCVLYDDMEWEFVNLAVEPYALLKPLA
jgi:hypothetical protein